jgi:tRNA threonylcarbamoyladenosine dehydratase
MEPMEYKEKSETKMEKETQWDRTRLLLGEEGFQKLQHSFVLIAGCGAVGGFAIESLARAGVGHLALVDFDKVALSNINRQIFALHSTLNRPKTYVAKERIADIAPSCKVDVFDTFICQETMDDIFKNPPDFAVDAIDSLVSKALLIEELEKRNIPFISSMGAARKTDTSLIKVDKMKKTSVCPLAGKLRKILRQRGVSLDFLCVYSLENAKNSVSDLQEDKNPFCLSQKKAEQDKKDKKNENAQNPPNLEKARIFSQRSALGSLPTVTGIFGLTLANEAIKHLLQNKVRIDKKE